MLKMTALHWATEHGHRGVVELLVKYSADTHALSKFDKTPFNIAVDRGNTELMLLLQVKICFLMMCCAIKILMHNLKVTSRCVFYNGLG